MSAVRAPCRTVRQSKAGSVEGIRPAACRFRQIPDDGYLVESLPEGAAGDGRGDAASAGVVTTMRRYWPSVRARYRATTVRLAGVVMESGPASGQNRDAARPAAGGSTRATLTCPTGRIANNLVYGSLLTLGYFLAVPDIKTALDHSLVQGGLGFLVLVICHAYAQYVSGSANLSDTALRRTLLLFAVRELALVLPFAIAAVVALIVQLLTGSQPIAAYTSVYLTLAIVWVVSYGTVRRTTRSRVRAHTYAALATAVGLALSILRILK